MNDYKGFIGDIPLHTITARDRHSAYEGFKRMYSAEVLDRDGTYRMLAPQQLSVKEVKSEQD